MAFIGIKSDGKIHFQNIVKQTQIQIRKYTKKYYRLNKMKNSIVNGLILMAMVISLVFGQDEKRFQFAEWKSEMAKNMKIKPMSH